MADAGDVRRLRLCRGGGLRALLVVAVLGWCLPGVLAMAQGRPGRDTETSPASRHAQVIAHGVMTMPAAEIGWRVSLARAPLPHRATAAPRLGGFILAAADVVVVTGAGGGLLARLAPGEALWVPPGASRAVVSLEREAVDYYDIALLPAAQRAAQGRATTLGASFAAPPGEAFDVDLMRDVLQRDEESIIPAGAAPAFLVVTAGSVFLTAANGDVVPLAAGGAAQIGGDATVSGASRAPAAFVVARIGAAVPARLALRADDAAATPQAEPGGGMPPGIATPVARVSDLETASATGPTTALTVPVRACPPGMTAETLVAEDCEPAPPGTTLSLLKAGVPQGVAAVLPDSWSWRELPPGEYTLTVNAMPEGYTGHTLAGDSAAFDLDGTPAEVQATLYLLRPSPATEGVETDADADGLSDAREAELATNPFLPDTDADRLSDRDEADLYGTDPRAADTDRDDLTDGDELAIYQTNPFLIDTDDDGFTDSEEIAAGADPRDPAGMPPTPTPVPAATPEPTATATPPSPLSEPPATPIAIPDGMADLDGDGLNTADEVNRHATNPTVSDTDGDGASDGEEIAAGSDPLQPGSR